MDTNKAKNTTPELFDDAIPDEATPTKEEILMSERDILAGLLELGAEKDDQKNYYPIEIKRSGVLKLSFRIRPITENENQTCYNRASRYAPTKPGQPKVVVETNQALYRSYIIYTATVDEDRGKVWDNKEAQARLGVLQSVEMIDRVLKAGEKERVIDKIDEISGFGDDAEETARD
jgi:hypothetical protein